MKNKLINKKIIFLLVIFCIIIISVIVYKGNFFNIMTNTYDISEISSNIDKIQIGDKINYTSNGFSDWEVLSINKGNNTIEIVSTTETERLYIKSYYDFLTYNDQLNNIAKKYATGDNAIAYRNLNTIDLDSNITKKGCFWLESDKTTDEKLYGKYVCEGSYEINTIQFYNYNKFYFIPIVQVMDDNSQNYKIGDNYTYSSNGYNTWSVYTVMDKKLEIIPNEPYPYYIFKNQYYRDINNNFDKILVDFYDNDNVLSVRNVTIDDINNFSDRNIIYSNPNIIVSNGTLTENKSNLTSGENTYNYSFEIFKLPYYYYDSSKKRYMESNWSNWQSYYELGVRPVITIKFDDKQLTNTKKINTNLKVGDYVDYSAKQYNGWRVIHIDNDNDEADIISDGIVKSVKLSGAKDYNNYETIMQKEVDSYKDGDNVISARIPNATDISYLNQIKDKTTTPYWLNNKAKCNFIGDDGTNYKDTLYSISVASYNITSYATSRKWIILKSENNSGTVLTYLNSGDYNYIAGIRPVIKVKMSNLSKKEVKTTKSVRLPSSENAQTEINTSNLRLQNDHSIKIDDSYTDNSKENSCDVYDDTIDKNEKKTVKTNNTNNIKSFTKTQIIIMFSSSILIGIIITLFIYINPKKRNNH